MANTLRFKRGLVSTIPTALAGEPLFTTDTFDLYIGNGTTNTRFQKYIASGTTSQLLRGDGSLLTMPIVLTSPSTGQVLKYNGTNWVNDSDAGITGSGAAGQVAFFTGATTQGGSNNLFWDATNNRLGIGTNAPAHRLDVNGNIRIPNSGFIYINSSTGTAIGALSIDAGDNTIINTATAGDIYLRSAGSTIARLLSTGDVNIGGLSATTTPIVKITSTGRLGVNNTAPTYTTDITGTLRSTTTTYLATSSGNVLVGSTTDNGLRFQVTGDGYFSGSVGIGTSTFSGYNLVIGKNISGGASIYSVSQSGTVQTDVTTNAGGFINFLNTAASTNVTSYYHYRALQNTIGASTTLGNQFGYHVADLTTAVYNYAFYGNVSSGSNKWNLYMNGSAANYLNGNLGVGITTPTARVEAVGVSGTTLIRATGADSNGNADVEIRSTGTTGASRLFFGDTAATSGSIIYNHSNDSMQLATVATIRATLDASGNLGLGVTPSAWNTSSTYRALDISNSFGLLGGGGSADLYFNLFFNASSQFIYKANGSASAYSLASGQHRWYNVASGTAGAVATLTQAMTLFATGNLAVGTTTDAGYRLDVNGTMRVSGASTFSANVGIGGTPTAFSSYNVLGINGTAGGMLELQTNGTSTGILFSGTNLITLRASTSSAIRFETNGNNERARITSAGDFGIGTLSPAYKLDVQGTLGVTGAATFSSSVQAAGFITSGGAGYAVINSAAATVTALRPTGGGASIMSTNSNGLHIAVGTQAAGDLILASNNTERIRLSSNGFFSQLNATNPSASITDSYIQYSADVVAGNAAPHFRTENGAVIKLYQETTGVGNSIISLGGGNAVLDDTTFDGYTLRQIVKALRNQGILQ